MSRRNLQLLIAFALVSLVCYQKRDPFGATFVRAMHKIDQEYVEPVDRRELFEAAMTGMMGRLDEYSGYIGPQDFNELQESLGQEFGGIGIEVFVDPQNKNLTVATPLVGTPAYEAGVRAGDQILKIDGAICTGLSVDEARSRLRGTPGETVAITVLHPGETLPTDLRMQRAIIEVETVLGDSRDADNRWNYFLTGSERIGYIRVTSFGGKTTEELRAAVDWLLKRQMRGLILDLRNDPGGLLETAVGVCDLFINEGPIVSTRGRNKVQIQTYEAHPLGTYPDFPMVVLVNRYSASASEIVAACLQDHGRASIVGERTWGKGSVQDVIPLEGGRSALKLTMATYWRPSNKNIHRTSEAADSDEWGVLPDPGGEVKLEQEQFERLVEDRRRRDIVRPMGRTTSEAPLPRDLNVDPQLKRAVELLDDKISRTTVAKAG
ncbi:MAG: S41 family peptidase [Planctomycetaceae bacterium]|nr:S41 family peptidase [Planctomycetaceae bacterium]